MAPLRRQSPKYHSDDVIDDVTYLHLSNPNPPLACQTLTLNYV